jgi:hypothetical protein
MEKRICPGCGRLYYLFGKIDIKTERCFCESKTPLKKMHLLKLSSGFGRFIDKEFERKKSFRSLDPLGNCTRPPSPQLDFIILDYLCKKFAGKGWVSYEDILNNFKNKDDKIYISRIIGPEKIFDPKKEEYRRYAEIDYKGKRLKFITP